jgi:hypothetical protein
MKKRRELGRPQFKSISHESLLGQKGMNMAEAVVLKMGYVWNPIHIESGIDAIIEIRDPSTGETKNKIVQAQVKAVSKFTAEQGDAFSFSCERAHIGYWLGGTARVILLVCRPETGEIYWKDLKSYFSLPENRERCTVRFSKSADRFDVSTTSALLNVAKPEGGLALGPLPKREILGINLLPLGGYPENIFSTPTKAASWDAFLNSLKAVKKPWLREFIWKGGVLYSLFDPEAEGIVEICEGTPKPFPTADWADSSNLILQRYFAELLGRAFEHLCYHRDVFVERETGVFYFAAPADGSELKIRTKSSINNTTKTVVSRHHSVRQDGTLTHYYKHYAFEGRVRRFAGEWFFELTPTYHFTADGKVVLPTGGALLAGIKRMERHSAVLNAFLTWKEYLTEESLLKRKSHYLSVFSPTALPIDRGIDDSSWRPPVTVADPLPTPAEADDLDEPEPVEEGSLFSWKHD